MKKLCALILCVLLVSVVAFSAFAAGETTVKVTPSATEVKRGEEVTVVVSLIGENVWSSMGYIPYIPSDYFTVVSGEALMAGMLAEFTDTDGGVIMLNSASAAAGDAFRFVIKIKDNAPFGEFKISDPAFVSMKNGSTPIATILDEATLTVVCDHQYAAEWTPDPENPEQHIKECGVEGCDEKLTEAHAFDAKKDAEKHWEECACGQKKNEATHTFDAKKDATYHWEECSCGEVKGKAAHTFDAKKDAEKHWEECACGEKKGEAAHTFDWASDENNHWGACACGETKDVTAHNFGTELKKNAEKHWLECECGKKSGEVAHSFDTKKDAEKHWEECVCGEKKGEAAHTYANFTKVDDAQHKGVCACTAEKNFNHEWDEGTVTKGPKCDELGEMTYKCLDCAAPKTEPIDMIPHELENITVSGDKHSGHCTACDQDIEEEHEFVVGNFDEEKHWVECVCGEKSAEAEHEFAEELTADEDGHWYACADCPAKKDFAEHTFVAKADKDNHWTECACGEIADKAAHEFVAKNDKDNHWTECACGEKTEAAAHEFTYKVEGDKHYQVCACGEKTEAAAHEYDEKTGKCACGAEKAAEEEKPSKDPEQPSNGDTSFAMALVVLMVLSACGMAVTVIARKKIAC